MKKVWVGFAVVASVLFVQLHDLGHDSSNLGSEVHQCLVCKVRSNQIGDIHPPYLNLPEVELFLSYDVGVVDFSPESIRFSSRGPRAPPFHS